MTFSNVNALDLLGKQVSFETSKDVKLTETCSVTFHQKLSGTVTNVVLNLHSGPEISINDGDYYVLSEVDNFHLAQ